MCVSQRSLGREPLRAAAAAAAKALLSLSLAHLCSIGSNIAGCLLVEDVGPQVLELFGRRSSSSSSSSSSLLTACAMRVRRRHHRAARRAALPVRLGAAA